MTESSPRRAGFWRRALAFAIDSALVLIVALLLARTAGRWFSGRAVIMLSIGSPDTFWRGPIPMIIGILGPLVYGLPFAGLLVMLPEAFAGAGFGKWALRLRVRAADGAAAPVKVLVTRCVIKCVGLWGMTLALLLGKSPVAFLALAATVIVGAGFMAAAGREHLALHDRMMGTAVVRT